jgi:hypothetical protein
MGGSVRGGGVTLMALVVLLSTLWKVATVVASCHSVRNLLKLLARHQFDCLANALARCAGVASGVMIRPGN